MLNLFFVHTLAMIFAAALIAIFVIVCVLELAIGVGIAYYVMRAPHHLLLLDNI
jgi:hypothetical protein